MIFNNVSNKKVKPKKVDTRYKYIRYKLKVVIDTYIFCYQRQRNNDQFDKVKSVEEKNRYFRSTPGTHLGISFLI